MPRKDKTFSEKDVIRIYKKHLTAEEQLIVWNTISLSFEEVILPDLGPLANFLFDILKFRDIINPIMVTLSWIPVVGTFTDMLNALFDLVEETIKEIAKV